MLRVVKKIFHRGLKRDSFSIYKRLGLKLLLNYSNYIDRKLLVDNNYESQQFTFAKLLHNEHNFDYFLDIGANFGLYSLQFANLYPNLKIVAWEPDKRNYAQFQSNILLNRLHNKITCHNQGASNKKNVVKFLQNNGNNTGQSRIENTKPSSTKDNKFSEAEINVDTVDNIFKKKGYKILIKIDVEGHEKEVIEGMITLLDQNDCFIQVELLEGDTVSELFLSLGYSQINQVGDDYYFCKNEKDKIS